MVWNEVLSSIELYITQNRIQEQAIKNIILKYLRLNSSGHLLIFSGKKHCEGSTFSSWNVSTFFALEVKECMMTLHGIILEKGCKRL